MAALDALRVCVEVAELLDSLGVRYFVGGSLASSLHGVPRSTNDADLAAELREEHVDRLVRRLRPRFYVDQERVLEAVSNGSSFNAIELATMFKVDIFVLGRQPRHREELARRRRVTLPESGAQLDVASAEDIVLEKLRWYRLGGGVSDRQWRDVVDVLKVQRGQVDRAYLARGAQELEVDDLLAVALRESELAEPSRGDG